MQREGAVDLSRALLNSDGLSGTQAQEMEIELVATSHLDQQSAEVATQLLVAAREPGAFLTQLVRSLLGLTRSGGNLLDLLALGIPNSTCGNGHDNIPSRVGSLRRQSRSVGKASHCLRSIRGGGRRPCCTVDNSAVWPRSHAGADCGTMRGTAESEAS